MTELWLKFIDEYGETRRVPVESEVFVVGRHTDNDLSIADNKLSRQHIKIERFADIFVVSDCGSSNGTTLNGMDLADPAELKDRDRLCLGGSLEIEVESASATATDGDVPDKADGAAEAQSGSGVSSSAASTAAGTKSVSASSASGGSIPTIFYFLAPAFVLIALVLGGGLFFAFSGKENKTVVRRSNDFIYSNSDLEEPRKNNKNSGKTPEPTPSISTVNTTGNQTSDPLSAQTPVPVSGDIDKVKQNSASFMRRIAQNDPNPFLTQEQAGLVNERIKSLKNSPGLLENIKAVKKDAAQFESLATSKNLKPQFLAAAALTSLGAARGNPAETAQQMLPILSELKVKLDNKLADDNLLIVAAFDQGKAGKFGSLGGRIEALAKTSTNVSPRQIRTIWFLKEKGKITDADFEFALRFLAIGTIMQNPKDFDVNAEAVTF